MPSYSSLLALGCASAALAIPLSICFRRQRKPNLEPEVFQRKKSPYPDISDEEWVLRVELAALYRIAAVKQWDELIYNHITIRVPGEDDAFLINPFGLRYDEVTAGSLMKVTSSGKVLHWGNTGLVFNYAGFIIHSAIHKNRHDLACILHHHNRTSIVVASTGGLQPYSQSAAIVMPWVSSSTHVYEGIASDPEEQARILKALGDKSILFMENHGVLVCGGTVQEVFYKAFYTQLACDIQADLMKSYHEDLKVKTTIPEHVMHNVTERLKMMASHQQKHALGHLEFNAMVRLLEKNDPSFASVAS